MWANKTDGKLLCGQAGGGEFVGSKLLEANILLGIYYLGEIITSQLHLYQVREISTKLVRIIWKSAQTHQQIEVIVRFNSGIRWKIGDNLVRFVYSQLWIVEGKTNKIHLENLWLSEYACKFITLSPGRIYLVCQHFIKISL